MISRIADTNGRVITFDSAGTVITAGHVFAGAGIVRNALGRIIFIQMIASRAQTNGSIVLLDGASTVAAASHTIAGIGIIGDTNFQIIHFKMISIVT